MGQAAKGARLVEVRHLSKTFPGVRALRDVSLHVDSGEVVALLGHNGSGKSTLIKVLAGVHRPDQGGEVVHHAVAGTEPGRLHFIHQDLGLIPTLNTLENLDLGRPLGRRSALPVRGRRERRRALALIGRFGASFDVQAPVARLSPAERTIVAIARALDGWTSPHNVLVLDEPTAALHGQEVDKLLGVVSEVAAQGAGILFISHRLDEVVRIADRVLVLRDGALVASRVRGEFDHDGLVRLIAGEQVPRQHLGGAGRGPVRLAVRGLRTPTLSGVDLDLHAGEVVGVSGLVGSGMEELAGAVFGALPRGGEIVVDERPLRAGSPAAAIAAGVAFPGWALCGEPLVSSTAAPSGPRRSAGCGTRR